MRSSNCPAPSPADRFQRVRPIQEARLIKAGASGYLAAVLPSGMRAVSTEISAETSAGGFVIPGDSVDVILTRRDHAAEKQGGRRNFRQRDHLCRMPACSPSIKRSTTRRAKRR